MKRKIKFETHDNNNNNLTEFNHGPLHKNTNNNILTTRARTRDFHLPNVTRRSYTYYCKLLDYLQIQVVKHTFLFPQYTEKKYFLNAVWRNNEAVKNMTGLTWLDPSFDKELNSFFFKMFLLQCTCHICCLHDFGRYSVTDSAVLILSAVFIYSFLSVFTVFPLMISPLYETWKSLSKLWH